LNTLVAEAVQALHDDGAVANDAQANGARELSVESPHGQCHCAAVGDGCAHGALFVELAEHVMFQLLSLDFVFLFRFLFSLVLFCARTLNLQLLFGRGHHRQQHASRQKCWERLCQRCGQSCRGISH